MNVAYWWYLAFCLLSFCFMLGVVWWNMNNNAEGNTVWARKGWQWRINSPKHINIILALFSRLQTLGDLLDYNGDWQDANVLVLVSINQSTQLSTHHTYHSLLITSFLYFPYFCWKQNNNSRMLNMRYSPFLHVYIFLQKCHIY